MVANPAVAYHEYLGPAMFVPCSHIVLRAAAIGADEAVLDVACGTGIVTAQVRAARVVGLDVSPRMLEIARRSPGEWIEGSAQALPFGREFDVVLCQHGLQFFPDRLAGAREMRRVAARAVVACWQSLEQQSFFATLVREQGRLIGASVDQPFSLGEANALREILREAGFDHVEVTAHVIDARFPEPARFMQMCAHAALATMPERFAGVDPEPFAAELTAACASELARYTDGDTLRFPIPTNIARAW